EAVPQNGLAGLDRRQRGGDAQGSRCEDESGRARIRRKAVRPPEGRIELARPRTVEAGIVDGAQGIRSGRKEGDNADSIDATARRTRAAGTIRTVGTWYEGTRPRGGRPCPRGGTPDGRRAARQRSTGIDTRA